MCQGYVWRFKGLVVLEILLDYKCTSMYLSLGSCTVIIHLPFSTRKKLSSFPNFPPYNHHRGTFFLGACNASWGNSSSLRPHFPTVVLAHVAPLHPLLVQSNTAFPLLFLTSFHYLCLFSRPRQSYSLQLILLSRERERGNMRGEMGGQIRREEHFSSLLPNMQHPSVFSFLFFFPHPLGSPPFLSSPSRFFTPPLTRAG